MTLTLAQARTVVLDHLDDDNTRWSNTQVDTGLSFALSTCLFDYVSGGGDRFDTVGSFTSTSAGVVDMSSVSPIVIRGVSLLVGTRYFPLQNRTVEARGIDDSATRTLQIRYVRNYSLSATTSHPLVGVGATAAQSWDAFDHWVCVRAAQFCSVKDAEERGDLAAQEAKLSASILTSTKIPASLPFPGRSGVYSRLVGWVWKRDSVAMQLVRPV